MTLSDEKLYWNKNKEWYRINDEGEYELTEKAPEKAKKSFEIWNEPQKDN